VQRGKDEESVRDVKHTTAPARTITTHLFLDPFRQHALHQSPQEVEARVGVDEVDAVDAEGVVRRVCEKLLRAQAGDKDKHIKVRR
jgi:hypothetical protein